MRNLVFILIGILITTLIPATTAFSLDTSAPLLCSVISVAEYSLEEGCLEGTADNFDLPQFVKFDLQKKMIFEVGETGRDRKSKIVNHTQTEGQLIMQGVENGRSWSAVIGDQGKMTATVTGNGFGFVIFGACISQ
jgi:hypothetical protein